MVSRCTPDGHLYTDAEAALSASATEAEWAAATPLQRLAAEDVRERRRARLDDIMRASPPGSVDAVFRQVMWRAARSRT